jgi:hypothetical protein
MQHPDQEISQDNDDFNTGVQTALDSFKCYVLRPKAKTTRGGHASSDFKRLSASYQAGYIWPELFYSQPPATRQIYPATQTTASNSSPFPTLRILPPLSTVLGEFFQPQQAHQSRPQQQTTNVPSDWKVILNTSDTEEDPEKTTTSLTFSKFEI